MTTTERPTSKLDLSSDFIILVAVVAFFSSNLFVQLFNSKSSMYSIYCDGGYDSNGSKVLSSPLHVIW